MWEEVKELLRQICSAWDICNKSDSRSTFNFVIIYLSVLALSIDLNALDTLSTVLLQYSNLTEIS